MDVSIFSLSLVFSLLISPSLSLTCTTRKFISNTDPYPNCLDLPTLTAYLHFSYNAANTTLSVAFSAPPSKPGGWIAWAINPTGTGMAGSQTLVAYKDSTAGVVKTNTIDIQSYGPLKPGKLAFDVWDLKAEEGSGGSMSIFAKVKVPDKLAAEGKVNMVWQVGPSVGPGGMVATHAFDPANLNAMGVLDLSGNQTFVVSGGGAADSKTKYRNIHGILNAVGWGFLFPSGIIIARYMRVFKSADPAWFYLHIYCQLCAYVVGVSGWATSLKLGESPGLDTSVHHLIGGILVVLATIQMLALLLRPKKDHKYRFYWNIYHHGLGYAIVLLSFVNVFKGIAILNPPHQYKSAYVTVVAILVGLAVILEAITWGVVLKRKR